ncbi:uncharacterized protein LOC106179543 isoform X2 [Lingula anatina]|uniref:Uncharacterized protein LOC106179543 isoform X2 n=1 Tax=Lingula anatina TaxID=7574 RepID=A0A1S3K7T3_LINAN|nr:uncharacterized protein LOC106179543 isoform X2 [Lingula anatina]|eukprot:XP_013418695.1 uncharacterized protein LOC106179543 isoform X2 [Lingula anatina]
MWIFLASRFCNTGSYRYGVLPAWPAKTFAGLSPKEWAFLVVSILNLLAALGFTGYSLWYVVDKDKENTVDFTFAVLLLINIVFCTFYVVHGLFREREFELYAFIAATLVVVVYCITEYAVNVAGHSNPIKLPRLIVSCALALPNIVLAWMVARDFGFLAFRIVGASEALQLMYRQSAAFSTLLKFDFQVGVSFVVLVLEQGVNLTTLEIVTLSVGLPFSFLWLILGWITMRKEIKPLMWIFIVLGLVGPAYVIYKIVMLFENLEEEQSEKLLIYAVIVAGALELLVHVILLIQAVVVYRNFKKGLKERAFDPTEQTSLLVAAGRR